MDRAQGTHPGTTCPWQELLAVSLVEESCEVPVAEGLDGKNGTPSLHTSAKSTGQEEGLASAFTVHLAAWAGRKQGSVWGVALRTGKLSATAEPMAAPTLAPVPPGKRYHTQYLQR